MIEYAYIYRIISPTGSVYIGSSTNIERRFNYYKRLKCKSQIKLYRSFVKYGVTNHRFQILDYCPQELKLKAERIYGIAFDVLNRQNLNLKLPGKDDLYSSFSEETREKMSAWQRGRKLSDEVKKNMSEGTKGHIKSEETRLKLSIANKGKGGRLSFLGKKHSEATKIKMSQWQKGKPKKSKYVNRSTKD